MSEALQAATRALNAATEDLKRVTAGIPADGGEAAVTPPPDPAARVETEPDSPIELVYSGTVAPTPEQGAAQGAAQAALADAQSVAPGTTGEAAAETEAAMEDLRTAGQALERAAADQADQDTQEALLRNLQRSTAKLESSTAKTLTAVAQEAESLPAEAGEVQQQVATVGTADAASTPLEASEGTEADVGATVGAAATAAGVAIAPGGWSWGKLFKYALAIAVLVFLGSMVFRKIWESDSPFWKRLRGTAGGLATKPVGSGKPGSTGKPGGPGKPAKKADAPASVGDAPAAALSDVVGDSATGPKNKGPGARPPSPDTAGSTTQRAQKGKSGFCYIGEDRGFRSCIKVDGSSQCMSGQIFASQAQCVNPELRE